MYHCEVEIMKWGDLQCDGGGGQHVLSRELQTQFVLFCGTMSAVFFIKCFSVKPYPSSKVTHENCLNDAWELQLTIFIPGSQWSLGTISCLQAMLP